MDTFDLLIQDCQVLLPNLSVLSRATIGIRQGRIARIEASESEAREMKADTRVNGQGKIAMPGMVDGHTHSAQQLLRGSVLDEMPMVWARILVPFESNLTPDDVYAGALLFCVENLKAGITCFADAGGPHMEATAQAALETGIRANIAPSTMDSGEFVPAGMKQTVGEAISRTEKLYADYHNRGDGRIRIWFGLRQAMTSSPELVEAVSARSKELGTGVHIHLAEHIDEVGYCLQRYHLRPAEWFDSYGLLGPNLIAAHAVRLSDREVRLVSERQVNIVHCPRANLMSHGFSKTPLLLALGANVALGTDGASNGGLDLFEQMRLLKAAMQARYGLEINDPVALPALETVQMATLNGARAVMLEDDIGSLEVGKKADIILIDLEKSHLSPTAHLVKTLVTAARAEDVNDVIVDGRLLVKDHVFLPMDEREIRRRAGETLLRVGRRAGLSLQMPYVESADEEN